MTTSSILILQTLDKVTRDVSNVDDSNATTGVNAPKNRYQDKIPCKEMLLHLCCNYYSLRVSDNHTRVRLKPAAAPGHDYINASFIDVS